MGAHIGSYYAATARNQLACPRLQADIDVDVAIVGAGFTGVATGLELAERGLRVAICEAHQIGWGATSRNGGQITGSLSGDSAMERAFAKSMGAGAAEYVWDLRWRGHDIIRKRVEAYDIDCDLRFGHLQTALNRGQFENLKRMHASYLAHGMADEVSLVSQAEIPDYLETDIYVGGLLNRRNMHLHSLDLCLGEAAALMSLGGQIFEQSTVVRIEHARRPKIITEQGSITADRVVLAGNAYHLLEQPAIAGKLFPASLANMATEPLSDSDAEAINPQRLAVYDDRFVLDYYRLTGDNRLLFGGGTNYSGRASRRIAQELRPALERTFPRLKGIGIDYSWEGRDGITLNRIPQVGVIGDSILYVQGYSGHGIALSHIMAEITAKALTGDGREFDMFKDVAHWHMPLSRQMGSGLIALGMLYYKLRDRLT